MQKIKDFIILNRLEILSILSLILIFFYLIIKFWHNFGIAIIDCGREAYLPEEILKGKVLYKDLFNFYGPLSYLINAGFYKILGVNLDTLRIAGTINAFLTLSLLYYITRLFTSKRITWLIIVFIMINCAFRAFNYVFPYAYAVTYAFSSFLFSVLFLLLYLKTSKSYFIPLSWFFIGVSFTSKADYFIYIVFLALLTVLIKIYKKIDIKYIIYSVVSFLIVPLISFLILFSQGLTFRELFTQVQLIKKFAVIPSNIYFQMTKVGLYPYVGNLIRNLKYFLLIFPSFLVLLAALYFALKFNKITIKFLLSLSMIGFLFYNLFPQVFKTPYLIRSSLSLSILLVFGFMFYRIMIGKKYSYELTYGIFTFTALVISFKAFFFLNYGTFAMEAALGTLLLFILFLILYFQTFQKYFMLLSWNFLGISIALEWTYLWCVIILALLTIFAVYRKKLSSKYILYCIIAFLIFLAVFYSDIDKFYSMSNNLVFGFDYFRQIFINFINLAIVLAGIIYFSLEFLIFPKISKINYEKFIKFILGLIFLLILFYIDSLNFLKHPALVFSWLPLFTLFLSCFMLAKLIKNKNYSKYSIYVIFFIAAFLASLKSVFFLNMDSYGSFTLPLLLIANVVLITEYLPSKFKFIDKKFLQQAFFIIILGVTLICYKNLLNFYNNDNVIKTEKGSVTDTESITLSTQQIINYIKKNLQPKDSILIMPEGVMINFLTGRPSNGFYYSTIPPYYETFGEDKILSDIKKNPAGYIIINDRDTSEYNYKGICKDYGFKICKWVNSSYVPIKSFANVSEDGDKFKQVLYKKK